MYACFKLIALFYLLALPNVTQRQSTKLWMEEEIQNNRAGSDLNRIMFVCEIH